MGDSKSQHQHDIQNYNSLWQLSTQDQSQSRESLVQWFISDVGWFHAHWRRQMSQDFPEGTNIINHRWRTTESLWQEINGRLRRVTLLKWQITSSSAGSCMGGFSNSLGGQKPLIMETRLEDCQRHFYIKITFEFVACCQGWTGCLPTHYCTRHSLQIIKVVCMILPNN